MRFFLLLLSSFLFYVPMHTAKANEILSCHIGGEEQAYLQLKETKGQMAYTYGLEAEAEPRVSFRLPLDRLVYRSWSNQGDYFSYLVVLRHGEYVYSVYSSYDNWSGLDATGVTVEHNDVFLINYKCQYATVKGDLVDYVLKRL